MFRFDHRRFFTDFSFRTGLTLTPERRNALDSLLTKFKGDAGFTMLRELAYVLATICSGGMREGWFTGKKLDDFIMEGKPPDYVGARRVINGTDHAQDIATLATPFELLLRASV